MLLEDLNQNYQDLQPKERLQRLYSDFDPSRILITSSFGSTSVLLLHMISQVKPDHPVYFVDTSYHFPQTKEYVELLRNKLNLNIQKLRAEPKKNQFTKENQTWKYNHELCCFINKIDPVDQIVAHYDVWISGLFAFQNSNRSKLKTFEPKDQVLKFHPVIDMSKEEVATYLKIYDLPVHPLVSQGYDSIGCTHCTKKGEGRVGRWLEFSKTECGLHV